MQEEEEEEKIVFLLSFLWARGHVLDLGQALEVGGFSSFHNTGMLCV